VSRSHIQNVVQDIRTKRERQWPGFGLVKYQNGGYDY
jgi:hypothetical protein